MRFYFSKYRSLRPASTGRRLRALIFSGLLGFLVASCATGDIEMEATIAGGEKIRVPMGRGGAALTHEGGVQINIANFTLNPEKKLLYGFGFTDSLKRALRSVKVEDVSDEKAVTLVDVAEPKLSATGEWRGETSPMELSDPRFAWLATISNSVRVYRFTLTFADGQTLVLHQGTLFFGPMKAAVRQVLGQNY